MYQKRGKNATALARHKGERGEILEMRYQEKQEGHFTNYSRQNLAGCWTWKLKPAL